MPWLVHLIIGARPNLMKAAPLLRKLRASLDYEPKLIDTGQHYDHEMSGIFRQEFGMGDPDYSLSVGSATHGKQTAFILERYEAILLETTPDAVIVIGDVNSTVACSLAAAKMHIPVIHLEAGLRSNDRNMPEELNRIVTDQLSDLLWTPSPDGDAHLLASGIPSERIVRVGNIMIDSLVQMLPLIKSQNTAIDLNLKSEEFAVVTLHRPSNADNPEVLNHLLDSLLSAQKNLPLVWPLHPRTRARIISINRLEEIENSGIILTPPLGYIEFLSLVNSARIMITDSGGIQEETTWLGISCLTVRPNTERPITIDEGTNILVTPESLLTEINIALNNPVRKSVTIDLWDGDTATRCVNSLTEFLTNY